MNFKEYQDKAWSFALPSAQNFEYVEKGLVSEVGEFCGHLAKYIRDGLPWEEVEPKLKKELGDIQWFVAAMATMYGWNLQDIVEGNIKKLQARKEFGTISGSGDER